MRTLFLMILAMWLAMPIAEASDDTSFSLRAAKNDEDTSSASGLGKVGRSGGWLLGRARRVLVRKAADEGSWKLWQMEAMDAVLRAYNEESDKSGNPIGCAKFAVTVKHTVVKQPVLQAKVIEQHGDARVVKLFLKALKSVEDKGKLQYPSLLYGTTHKFTFSVCADGAPLSLGSGCL